MSDNFSPEAEGQPEKKKSQQLLLLLLLLLVALFVYLYFFTSLIRPLPAGQEAQPAPAPQAVVKTPLPPRPGAEPATPETKDAATAETKPAPEAPKAPAASSQAAKPAQPAAPAPAAKPAKTAQREKPAQPAASAPAAKPAKPAATAAQAKADKPAAAAPAAKGAKPAAAGKETKPAAATAKSTAKPAAETKAAQKQAAAGKATAAKAVPQKSAAGRTVAPAYALEISDLLESDMRSVTAKLKQAGIRNVVKSTAQKGEPMHRLYLADFGDRAEAVEQLEALKLTAPQAFMLKENGRYSVYAGSYLREGKAAAEQDRLYGKGVKLLMKTATVPVDVVKLRAGGFADQASAQKSAKKLKDAGVPAKVVKVGK